MVCRGSAGDAAFLISGMGFSLPFQSNPFPLGVPTSASCPLILDPVPPLPEQLSVHEAHQTEEADCGGLQQSSQVEQCGGQWRAAQGPGDMKPPLLFRSGMAVW